MRSESNKFEHSGGGGGCLYGEVSCIMDVVTWDSCEQNYTDMSENVAFPQLR